MTGSFLACGVCVCGICLVWFVCGVYSWCLCVGHMCYMFGVVCVCGVFVVFVCEGGLRWVRV